MGANRQHPGVALLKDGRVLVVGGTTPGLESLTSAEVYDPALQTWSATGSTKEPFWAPTATRLDDGRVLVAGNRGGHAEVYDPVAGTFVATGAMAGERASHTATLLDDGTVLVVGGFTVSGSDLKELYLASAEKYDPTAGTFTPTGSLNIARENAQAVRLEDGRVLIAGGDQGWAGGDAVFLSSAEIYDPATGAFTRTGSMYRPRTTFTATLLGDGRVLVAGGASGADGANDMSAEIYDPATGEFTSTGDMGSVRSYQPAAVLLADGRVLIFAGSGDDTAETYDPTTGRFNWTGSLLFGGSYPNGIRLDDGRVLVVAPKSQLYWP